MTTKKAQGGPAGLLAELEKDPAFQKASKEKIKQLQEALATLAQAQAHNVVEVEAHSDDNAIRFAVIGDTQLGSLYERLDVVRCAVKTCREEDIPVLVHTGDVLDGHKVYRGQEFELHKHGWEQQSQWFADEMPSSSSVQSFFITGNHDASFKSAAGVEVGKALNELRPDWQWLGADIGTVVLHAKDGRPLRVSLIHPNGGTAYALSYKPQKIVEQWAGGNKPDVLCIGHFHKSELMPRYRNVCTIQSGCCQDQTPFMKRGSLSAHVGFWIVEAVPSAVRGELWSRYRAEFISFYEKPQEDVKGGE